MAFAEFEDVERAYEGSLSSTPRVNHLIDSINARLRLLIPDLAARVDNDVDLELTARDVVAQAVIRSLSGSTQQVRSESEGVGPFSRTLTYTTDRSGTFPDEDLALLGSATTSAPIGSIHIGRPDWSAYL